MIALAEPIWLIFYANWLLSVVGYSHSLNPESHQGGNSFYPLLLTTAAPQVFLCSWGICLWCLKTQAPSVHHHFLGLSAISGGGVVRYPLKIIHCPLSIDFKVDCLSWFEAIKALVTWKNVFKVSSKYRVRNLQLKMSRCELSIVADQLKPKSSCYWPLLDIYSAQKVSPNQTQRPTPGLTRRAAVHLVL